MNQITKSQTAKLLSWSAVFTLEKKCPLNYLNMLSSRVDSKKYSGEIELSIWMSLTMSKVYLPCLILLEV